MSKSILLCLLIETVCYTEKSTFVIQTNDRVLYNRLQLHPCVHSSKMDYRAGEPYFLYVDSGCIDLIDTTELNRASRP